MLSKLLFFLSLVLCLFWQACDDNDKSSADLTENCVDGIDNDMDSWIDCWDPDCEGHEACKTEDEDVCGNGVREGTESCDMHDFGGESCATYGFDSGELHCTSTCSISLTACILCGNNICEQGENPSNCPFDCEANNTAICGNGLVENGEECDSNNLNNATCQSLNTGYTGGILRCGANCLFDYSGCEYCGNHICEATENVTNCAIDCNDQSVCGNNICEQGEDTNSCPQDCNVAPTCGNGIMENGEECDGNDFNSATCVSQGFSGGTLSCQNTCYLDTSNCFLCGDGNCDTNKGETTSNCPVDCSSSGCSASDVTVTPAFTEVELSGTTANCGNHPYTWEVVSSLVGDAVMFNAYETIYGWTVWWEGSSCSAYALRWDLASVNISGEGACWAVCTSSGANICCSVDSMNIPAICANTDSILIDSDQYY